ncbi:EF-hand domain-containing protein [Labrys okinawensis]|uniref:EF-hand domain-containing protein n=1 Tax=Labrys okinawensis TaxID=346911 RepID=UPI0039BC334D
MIRPLLLALVLTTAAGPALAQSTPAPAPAPGSSTPATPAAPAPATPDASATPAGKRGLTLAQFQARREKAYMVADTNGDGKISQAEWTAFAAKRNAKGDPAKLFARIDTNHDGFIDHDELDAFLAKRFARLDKNHDGLLTPDELPGHKSAAKQGQ